MTVVLCHRSGPILQHWILSSFLQHPICSLDATSLQFLTVFPLTNQPLQAQKDKSGANNPYLDDPEKSKKGEGVKDTAKIHGTVDTQRNARGPGDGEFSAGWLYIKLGVVLMSFQASNPRTKEEIYQKIQTRERRKTPRRARVSIREIPRRGYSGERLGTRRANTYQFICWIPKLYFPRT